MIHARSKDVAQALIAKDMILTAFDVDDTDMCMFSVVGVVADRALCACAWAVGVRWHERDEVVGIKDVSVFRVLEDMMSNCVCKGLMTGEL